MEKAATVLSSNAKKFLKKSIFFYTLPVLILTIIVLSGATYFSNLLAIPTLLFIILYSFTGFILYSFQYRRTYNRLKERKYIMPSYFKAFILFFVFMIPGLLDGAIYAASYEKFLSSIKNKVRILIFSFFVIPVYSILIFFGCLGTEKLIELNGGVDVATDVNEYASRVSSYKSPYLNKVFTLKAPMFLLRNLPKGYHANSSSVHLSPNLLVDFRPSCANCTGENSLESPLRLTLLRSGAKLKVVKSFMLKSTSMISSKDYEYLVVEDEHKNLAEISELGFNVDVVNASIENFDYDYPLMPLIDEFEVLSSLDLLLCESIDTGTDTPLEIKIIHLFKYYKVEKDVNILKIGDLADHKQCAIVNFKKLDPLFLFYYYGQGWGIYTRISRLENISDVNIVSLIPFDYNMIISKSPEELDSYQRPIF